MTQEQIELEELNNEFISLSKEIKEKQKFLREISVKKENLRCSLVDKTAYNYLIGKTFKDTYDEQTFVKIYNIIIQNYKICVEFIEIDMKYGIKLNTFTMDSIYFLDNYAEISHEEFDQIFNTVKEKFEKYSQLINNKL